ncbi:MAG TPA: hypothetical protein VFH50_12675 [Acidimicrobiales bacterium]|nr:hypothetical protein [Acidimicrobiales bacterium]
MYGEDPEHLLGGALAWATTAGVAELHLIAEAGTGMLARRAAAFSPAPRVWRLQGRDLHPAPPEDLVPEPGPPVLSVAVSAALAAARADGADVVTEHGVVSVEVLGLEVARVEGGPDGPELSIGVGRHDREARRLVNAGLPSRGQDPAAELRGVVSQVQVHRRGGGPAHPANQLAPERWLRAVLVRRPELVGAAALEPVSPPLPRPHLRARAVAPAVGTDTGGERLAVVCSTGVDPELVPAAVDVRLAAEREGRVARLAVVVPERDDHPVTRRLVAMLAEPAEIRTVPSDWRALT